jgi:hypothetical protein
VVDVFNLRLDNHIELLIHTIQERKQDLQITFDNAVRKQKNGSLR